MNFITCFSRSLLSSCLRICDRALKDETKIDKIWSAFFILLHAQCDRQTHQYDILLKCSVNLVRFGDLSSHCSCAQSSTSGISIFWNSCASSSVICSAISADLRSNSDGGLVITLKIGFIGCHFCCLNTMICVKRAISKQTIRFPWRNSIWAEFSIVTRAFSYLI